jgi:hypothetical protein
VVAGRNPIRSWFESHEANLAGAVYGAILVTSVIAAASAEKGLSLGLLVLTVTVTILVFWLAHVYARALAHSVTAGTRVTWPELRGLAAHEWPLLQAAIPSIALLVFGWLGLYDRSTALWLAVASGVALLVAWGFVYARAEGLGPAGTTLAVSINTAFGLAVVALKAFVSH